MTDEGIGAYEYWGQKGTDVQLVLSSACCQDDFSQIDPKEEDDTVFDSDLTDLGPVGNNLLDQTEIKNAD